MTGYINSIETMGLVDGPGIRMVIFMKGCPLRCLFCHNPETWTINGATAITSDEIVKKVANNSTYYENGGVTFSGGEPLHQPEFLLECLKKIKELGIHTALDTSGVGKGMYEEILRYTDLVILDIKAITPDGYLKMTSHTIDEFNHFKEVLNKSGKEVWLRQVIVPGINDNEEYIRDLKEYIKDFNNVTKVELLPYHLYGIEKYKELKIPYRLDGVPPMNETKLDMLDNLLKEE